jgi:hypothetical protein
MAVIVPPVKLAPAAWVQPTASELTPGPPMLPVGVPVRITIVAAVDGKAITAANTKYLNIRRAPSAEREYHERGE